jgi:hypothetical protein
VTRAPNWSADRRGWSEMPQATKAQERRSPTEESERSSTRTQEPEGTSFDPSGPLRPVQLLDLQRTAGNRAVTGLVASSSGSSSGPGGLSIQRAAPDPWAKDPKTKPGLLKRAGIAIKSFFTTTFGADPSKIKPEMPDVDEATRKKMYEIMAAAIKDRDTRKEALLADGKLSEDEAEHRANQEAFKDIPESWRPRVVTAAEFQVKKNNKALLDERVRTNANASLGKDYSASFDKDALKSGREQAFKSSLIGKTPEEVTRLKAQHEIELKQREEQKKSKKSIIEAREKSMEKAFESGMSGKSKEQKAAAKRVFDANRKKREARDKLARYQERMTGLPQEEIDRRTKLYAEKNGLQAGLDLSAYDTASSGIGGVGMIPTIGGALDTGSSEIAKLTGNTGVSGVSSDVGGREVQTQVGTATMGSDIIGSAGTIMSTSKTVVDLIKSIQAKSDGDPAQQEAADDGIVDGVLGIGQNAETLGGEGMALAKDFGGSHVNSVGIQGIGMPIFDLAANFLQLVRDARRVVDNARRASTSGKLGKHAQLVKDEVLGHVVGHVRRRGIHLACHYSVDALAAGLKIAGDVVTLTGVAAAAGQGVKLAGTAVGAVNSAARTVADSYLAGKALAARGEASLALPDSAEKLLQDDPLQVAQTLVLRGRAGDPQVLRSLHTFGIDEKVLKGSSDANLRALILARLESSENPQTITGKIGGLLSKIGGAGTAFAGGVRDIALRPSEIHQLRKVKNELGYGGRSDRGIFWGMKQFFSGPGRVDAQKSRIKSVVEKSQLEPMTKARLLQMSLTREQRIDKAEEEERSDTAKEISRPIPTDFEALSTSQLESLLERDDIGVEQRTQVALLFFEKRDVELQGSRQLAGTGS